MDELPPAAEPFTQNPLAIEVGAVSVNGNASSSFAANGDVPDAGAAEAVRMTAPPIEWRLPNVMTGDVGTRPTPTSAWSVMTPTSATRSHTTASWRTPPQPA
jgi:hypothetical protein